MMYSKSDINISLKKKANVQEALCSINLQKRESVSVGHIMTVTKNTSMSFAYNSKLYDSNNLFNCTCIQISKIGDVSYLLNIAYMYIEQKQCRIHFVFYPISILMFPILANAHVVNIPLLCKFCFQHCSGWCLLYAMRCLLKPTI